MKKIYTLLGTVLLMNCLITGQVQAQAQGTWNTYDGSVMPNESTPAFVTASVTPADPVIVATEQSIIDNPDVAGGRVLSFKIANAPHTSFLWRQNFPTTPTKVTAATIVVRAKGLPDVDRVFEIDLDFGLARETVYIMSNGTFTFNVARLTEPTLVGASLGENFNALAWHTYRFAKSGTSVSMYVDESNTPIATATVPNSTERDYFRIGDGSSGATNGALIDWIVWDATGAYSPSQRALPSTVASVRKDAFTPSGTTIYPNPLNGNLEAHINFTLPAASDVTIGVYDITGKKVGQQAFGHLRAADHAVALPVAGLSEGVYFIRIATNKSSVTQKLVVN